MYKHSCADIIQTEKDTGKRKMTRMMRRALFFGMPKNTLECMLALCVCVVSVYHR